MTEKDFSLRLARLREQKGISARDMSLSMGQNPGYINNIETGKSMPSLSGVFYICEFLGISPGEFFDESSTFPAELSEVTQNLKKLNKAQLANVASIIEGLAQLKNQI
ncbi:helix-turn-helix transcriptional regulator [Anaeromusa sp.]|uniref:helix-turn-helix domain-containing protein n=1 Tax=Anaeromusa sp. TaxID=1872520 RepID=UPI00263347BC|nr:helix-turn-helix transcriptional regulator [Anaeromusa sp.]MDD3158758.1 helix-turn-helix transcriptional regulator [Anaeromusa sp.]